MASNSIIAIKGNLFNKQSEIIDSFKYVDKFKDKEFDSYDTAMEYLFNNYFDFAQKDIALRGIWTDENWTIICDPEMVDSTNDDALELLSQRLQTEIYSFLIQTNSDSVGLAKFDQTKKRHFFKSDGKIEENYGSPLLEEMSLNLESSFYDDISVLTEKFGIDLEGKSRSVKFIVKELGYNEELKKELEKYKQPNKIEGKPWWKIW